MKCPYCSTKASWTFSWTETVTERVGRVSTAARLGVAPCPECSRAVGVAQLGTTRHRKLARIKEQRVVWPVGATGRAASEEIPSAIATEFLEASAVLSMSPRASAALSRCLLQTILREHYSIRKNTLEQEIAAFLKVDRPSLLAQALDAVRVIGNFAAHPMKNVHTGEIVAVEPGEAEWLLEVLEAMLDYSFVQPRALERRRSRLDAKLESLGKPPLRGDALTGTQAPDAGDVVGRQAPGMRANESSTSSPDSTS